MPVALVTGASSGIGHATARRLAEDGHTVYAAARRVDRMADLAAVGVRPIAMDITDPAQVEAAVARIEAEAGGVDVLVNNAGFATYGAVEDTPIADARAQFEVNLFGLALLTQRVLPHMRARKFGRIINISSIGGKIYTPMGAWYHATKHALEGWSDALRLELEPFGVDVVIIEPGLILTEFGDVMSGPLLARSGAGPYGEQARKVAKATARSYAPGGGSPPSVVADAIARAATARRPATRYAVGHLARLILFVRRWTSDRIFDWVIRQAS